jgi:TrmH family RNA methyltransferase
MDGTVALLLGREDCGLCSEELALCDMLISIPTSQEYPVMNLSHSAAVLFYELSRKKEQDGGMVEMARRESLDLLAERSRALLYEVSYPRHKVDYTLLMLRRILGRARLTEREARTLLGLIKNIRWRIEARDEGSEEGHKRESSEMAGQSAKK